MEIKVERVEYARVEPFRDLYRSEHNCQIIHDSVLRRGLGDAYLILVNGRTGGYGGVWNKYDPDRIMEFYTLPHHRGSARDMYRALAEFSGAASAEAQTNCPLMLEMLTACAEDITAENFLFEDAGPTRIPNPGGVFRRSRPGDGGPDPEAEWVFEVDGKVAAAGGYLCHYNPPYGDIYMAVTESERRKGCGSYIVQELKQVCYEAGRRPAARCNATNIASHRTLTKAGMRPCARLLTANLRRP